MRTWGKVMDKKLLIGSIIAAAILIGVSFTSVVGYNNVKSDFKVSPLFDIRTNRAIEEDIRNTLTTNYIGKENKVVIPFLIPTRATINQNIMQKIKETDDNVFEKLLAFIIQQIHYSDKIPPEILEAIYVIKDETNKEMHRENAKLDTVLCESLYCQTVRCDTVFKGCLTHGIFTSLIKILDKLYTFTEKIPLFKGNFILTLYHLISHFYFRVTTIWTLFCPP